MCAAEKPAARNMNATRSTPSGNFGKGYSVAAVRAGSSAIEPRAPALCECARACVADHRTPVHSANPPPPLRRLYVLCVPGVCRRDARGTSTSNLTSLTLPAPRKGIACGVTDPLSQWKFAQLSTVREIRVPWSHRPPVTFSLKPCTQSRYGNLPYMLT